MKFAFNYKPYLLLFSIALSQPIASMADPMRENHPFVGCQGHGIPNDGPERISRGEMPPMGMPPHLRGLNLTDAQEDSIFKIFYSQIPAMRDQAKLRHQTREKLNELAKAPTFDEQKAQKLADKLAALEKDFALNKARTDAKIFSLLTPEQKQKLQDFHPDKNAELNDLQHYSNTQGGKPKALRML